MIGNALRGFAVATAIGYVATKAVSGVDRRFQARNAERKATGTAEPATAEQRKAAVEAYLGALTDPQRAFEVPMAPGVMRLHGPVPTGFGREHLQWDLHLHLQYRLVGEIEVLDWRVDPPGRPDTVEVDYRLRPKVGPVLEVTEAFTVPADGLIHRIEGRVTRVGDTTADPRP